MSVILYLIGAFAVMAGAGLIAFGIPINEFSFGNTLIISGVTAVVGGLIVVGLAATVAQLHRLSEAIAARPPARELEAPAEVPVAAAPPARTPLPPRLRPEPATREAFEPRGAPPAETVEQPPAPSFAPPSLRNPESPPLAFEEDVSLSPRHPTGGSPMPPLRPAPPGANGGAGETGREPGFEPPWRAPPLREAPSSFESMWPTSEPKPPRSASGSQPPPPRTERVAPPAPPPASEPSTPSQPRSAAVLKSGVVDGMAYTLYVDGSIEAELPQGTLRFASIEDLRAHLEKNS
jgi:hypothetical protein